MIKVLFFLIISNALASQVKMRAREHFEVHEVSTPQVLEVYKGLTNTITLAIEKPYKYSYGLSFSPILANLEASNSDSFFGNKITQQNIGVHLKYFLNKSLKNTFARIASGYSKLEVDRGSRKEFFGLYSYLGIGYEIPYDKFGLALELAYRYADYNDSIIVKTISPSIGFHFYKNF